MSTPTSAPTPPAFAGSPAPWRRWSLWSLLVVLVVAMLGTLVWLAGRYEASQVQSRLDRDVADAAVDIRSGLARNLQSLLALQAGDATPQARADEAARLLRERREFIRLELRGPNLQLQWAADTPYRPPPSPLRARDPVSPADVQLACAGARRTNGAMYAPSTYVPQLNGLGLEIIELCVPITVAPQVSTASGPRLAGYLVASYGLQEVLASLVAPALTRHQDLSFNEADGTRLASLQRSSRRGTRMFRAQQLLDLPGSAMVLRLESWQGAPSVFPNVLTALVTFMSIALVSVLVLLGKDHRRRLEAERDLADALAFRKAMEDSLVTGLRARDLHGRITYLNPAFCRMVGFEAAELLGRSGDPPYWPPENVGEYGRRQAHRLAGGQLPPREGYESTFMKKDGTRFPVLIIEAPLINAQGLHTGWMGAFLDMSEQRRIEELSRASHERLQATARLATVGEMASLLSHELNQPLAAISSYATGSLNLLLQHQEQRQQQVQERRRFQREGAVQVSGAASTMPDAAADIATAMHRIAEQAERAGRVIRSVHDFVRRRDQSREAAVAHSLIDAVMPLVTLQARKLGVEVRITVAADLPPVLCDRTMVEQVLLNLARNGMQAMDVPDTMSERLLSIEVRAAASSGGATPQWLEFSVADGGAGIAPDVAERLFTPFFTTKPEGMGLGLSLCRTVIEQHGGFLDYRARIPTGTIFCFTLPAAPAPPAAASQDAYAVAAVPVMDPPGTAAVDIQAA